MIGYVDSMEINPVLTRQALMKLANGDIVDRALSDLMRDGYVGVAGVDIDGEYLLVSIRPFRAPRERG